MYTSKILLDITLITHSYLIVRLTINFAFVIYLCIEVQFMYTFSMAIDKQHEQTLQLRAFHTQSATFHCLQVDYKI